MAGTLKLERGGTEVDLNGGVNDMDGFIVQDKFWDIYPFQIARMGYRNPPPIVEKAIPILAVSSTVDGVATHMQSLHQMQRWATEYISERAIDDPVWLHAQWDSESGERRSVVREIRVQPTGNDKYKKDDDLVGVELQIVIVREPFWERDEYREFPSSTPSAAASVKYDYGSGHEPVGDVPARIYHLLVSPDTGDELGRIWIGVRSDERIPGAYTAANFANIWECEDGTNNASEGGISDAADATASGGNRVTVSESSLDWDNTWHECLSIKLSDATTYYAAQYGLLMWLLRSKVTAGEWEVQLRFGYNGMDDADFIQKEIVTIDNTSWDFSEMGNQHIPIVDPKAFSHSYEGNFEVQVWAQRTSGSGDLHLDCLCPIPVDEGYFICKEFDISAGVGNSLFIRETPLGKSAVAVTVTGPTYKYFPEFESNEFCVPPGSGRYIIVYARSGSSDITDKIDIGGANGYYERWLSLRGSE